MNYNLKTRFVLPLSASRNRGYMVGAIGGKQFAMKIFSPVPTHFLLTFYPFHTIYLLVMKTTKNYNSKKWNYNNCKKWNDYGKELQEAIRGMPCGSETENQCQDERQEEIRHDQTTNFDGYEKLLAWCAINERHRLYQHRKDSVICFSRKLSVCYLSRIKGII